MLTLSVRRVARACALPFLLAALSAGCARGLEKEVASARIGLERIQGGGDLAEGLPAFDLRVPVVRTKKKADGSAFGFLRANRRLYPSFSFSVVAGPVPGEADEGFDGGLMCIELDERATISDDLSTLEFVLLCARPFGDGLLVEAFDQGVEIGEQFLAGAVAALLRIRHDGSDLVFETAPASIGSPLQEEGLLEVARIEDYEPSTPGDALVPSLGASFLAHPAAIAFDLVRVETSIPGPVEGSGLTPEQLIALDVGTSLDATAEMLHAMNGFADPSDAVDLLLDARALVGGALDDLGALPGKAAKKARGALVKADKQLGGALDLIDAGQPPLKVLKKGLKAAKLQLKAVDVLDPLGG